MKHLYYHLLYLFLNIVCGLSSSTSRSGPYKTITARISTCPKYSYRLLPNPPMNLMVSTYNTTTKPFLLRGNFTVNRNVANAKLKLSSYMWSNGKWKNNFMAHNLGCRDMLVPLLCSALNIKFDRRHCMYLQGKYYFDNISANDLVHLVTKTVEYGKTLWTSEMIIAGKPFRSLFCLEYESWVIPI